MELLLVRGSRARLRVQMIICTPNSNLSCSDEHDKPPLTTTRMRQDLLQVIKNIVVLIGYRVNYSVLGNKEAALHAHINPRYEDEPEKTRGKMLPPYFKNPVPYYAGRDAGIMKAIHEYFQDHGLIRE